jgi:hypothetical protein
MSPSITAALFTLSCSPSIVSLTSRQPVGIRNSDHAVDLQVRRTRKNVSGNFLIVARVLNRVRRSVRGLRKRRRDPSPFFPQDLSASNSGLKQPGCQWRPEHDSQTAEIDAARVPAGPMSNALVASVIWVFDPHRPFLPRPGSARTLEPSPSLSAMSTPPSIIDLGRQDGRDRVVAFARRPLHALHLHSL